MKRVERFIDIDPGTEIEGRLLTALADVLDGISEEDAASGLAAFNGLGVKVYDSRLIGSVRRLKDLSPSP